MNITPRRLSARLCQIIMKPNLIPITNDLFDIAARLRTVNDGYRVYYNVARSRFEVYDESRVTPALAFVSPYGELDCRTVDYAVYSRVENADVVLSDMERNNAAVERNLGREALNNLEQYQKRRFYEGTGRY